MIGNSVTPDSINSPTTESLRRHGLELGLAAVGVTSAAVLEPALSTILKRKARGLNGAMQFTYRNPSRSTDPRQRMPTAQALIVAALGYGSMPIPSPTTTENPIRQAGRIARYVWSDHYKRLQQILEELAEPLLSSGFRAQVIMDSNHLVDRNVAWRAGIGWYGKNSNLLLPGTGSWYVLGSILTDAPLDHADQPMADGCGPCTRCIDDCPTDAIVAPGIVDARRCIAWLVQAAEPIPIHLRSAVGDRIYGCDDCQEVCPPNRQPSAITEAAELRADIAWILSADAESILARHGRWYIANRDVDVIRRTALVVLGNTAEPNWGTESITELLVRHLSSGQTQLRNHAIWATRRLGLALEGNHVAASSTDGDLTGLELPVCCLSSDPEQCADEALHEELVAPVEPRFSIDQWFGAASAR